MKEKLESLEMQKQEQQRKRAILQHQNTRISKPGSSLEDITLITLATSLKPPRTKAILNKPDKFAGNRKEYLVQRSGIATKIRIDGELMGLLDTTVTAYMASFCEGEAGMYLQSYERRVASGTLSYNEFWAIMDARYEDPHRQKRAAIEFKNIKQGVKPFVEFLVEFERLSSEAAFDSYLDPVKIQQLEEKISAKL